MAVPELIDNGWLSVPWAEYVGRQAGNPHGGIADGAFSWEQGNQQTMAILVNFDDVHVALQDLGGTNIWNHLTGTLDRKPPARHPTFDWLYCSRVASCRPVKWLSKENVLGAPRSRYRYYLLVLLFTQPRYRILSDLELDLAFPPVAGERQEYRRWVTWNVEPASELLSREGGSFHYAEGGAGITGTAVKAPLINYLSKNELVVKWHNLPRQALFGANGEGPATNIEAGLGKVNSAEFLHRPAGTLMLRNVRFVEHEAFHTGSINGGGSVPPLAYDVEFYMGVWDPPPFDAAHRGWNLAPRAGSDVWYLVTTDGNPASPTLARGYDFTTLFKLQS